MDESSNSILSLEPVQYLYILPLKPDYSMTVVSFRSAEELKEFILNVPAEQFNNFLPKLSLLEISQCILILQAKTTLKSKNRILDLVKFIDHSAQWEKLGSACPSLRFWEY